MKNKIVFAVLILLFPITIYASEIKLDCPKEIASKSEFTCQIKGKTDMLITGISAKVKANQSAELISVITDKKWQGDGKDGDIKIFIDPEITGEFDIGTIKLKTNGKNNNISIDSIIFYDDKVKSHKIESVSVNIPVNNEIKENDQTSISSNYLVDLEIEDHDLSFSKQNNEYEIKIGNENKLNINPVLEDESATYEILGNKNLKNGSKVKINVIAEDGSKSTYILNIVKDGVNKKLTLTFAIIIFVLVTVNLIRLVFKQRNRGKKNEC